MEDRIPAYEREPRLTRLETEVVETGVDGDRTWVALADTILYPEGGGQPADRGVLGGVEVVDVQRVGGTVRHVLAGRAPTGKTTVVLDWPRRFDHMQQHTAQHLLTALAQDRFGWHTTAFHLGDRLSDVELDVPVPDAERLAELEEAVAMEVRAARRVTARRVDAAEFAALPVRSRGLPDGHSGSVRLVEIEGIDLNNCGGTHCGSTAELEAVKLLGAESARGGTRLFYVAGARLRGLLEAHHERSARLRALLGTSDEELVERLTDRMEQGRNAERAARDLLEELAEAEAVALAARSDGVGAAHWPERDLPFLQAVARDAVRRAPQRVVLLTAGGPEEGVFLLAAGEGSGCDVKAVGPRVAEVLGGRGGGAGSIFQGKATHLSQRDEALAVLRDAGRRGEASVG